MKKVIGLTGGIASGKSTVVDFLHSKGYTIIDADKLVHRLQCPGGRLYDAILNHYGSDFFDERGQLIRKKLGELVFGDEKSRQALADLQNGIIREELSRLREEAFRALTEDSPEHSVLFMDIPLLFEEHYDDFDEVWLISLPENVQLERLMARNRLSEEEARKRIAAQMPLAEKKKLADRILDNSGSLESLRAQVERSLKEINQ